MTSMPGNTPLSYCPACGEHHFQRDSPKSHRCSVCRFTLYRNASAAVAAIFVRGSEVLLTVRAHAPAEGKLDLPGGFVDNDETAEQALEREVREELGVEVQAYEYFCSFPNLNSYGGLDYHVLDLFYIVAVERHGMERLVLGDEIADCRWLEIASMHFEDIAFPSTRKALQRYQLKSPGRL